VELGYLDSTDPKRGATVAFNVQPRPTGQLLIGSSRDDAGPGSDQDPQLRGRMLARAARFLPGLPQLKLTRTWVGFRPATPDGLPLIGRCHDGVYAAAGHEGLGIATALGTGQLLADVILDRTPAIDPTPFSPTRRAA
jgi:glycine/D-amino acid oxidase-like deaminating enzyme